MKNQEMWQLGLKMFGELSGYVVGPIIFALIIGKYVDKWQNTESLFTFVFLGMAFIASNIVIVAKARTYISIIDKNNKK